MTPISTGRQLRRSAPALAVVVALALVAVVLPTRPASVVDASGSAPGASTPIDAPEESSSGGADGAVAAGPAGVATGADGVGPAAAATGASSSAPRESGTGTGGGATAGRTAADGAPATGPAAGGTARTGDCSRNELTGGAYCRPPAFSGDNGGATHRGVTRDTVNVVVYQVKQNEQVQAILNTTGTANDAERQAVLGPMEKWFNENYETYGRRVKLIWFKGSSTGTDPAGQQADAVRVADELNAFAVVAISSAGPAFYSELHRRNIPAFTWGQFSKEYFEEQAPHLFGILPDRDLVLAHVAEYVCKRVAGRNAVHAGDPLYRNSKRKIGVVYQAESDNGPFLAKLLADCGVKVEKMIAYPADISQAVAIATNTVTQMREAGITTVTCICDPVAPIYFTQQATNQGWLPEWLHNGYFVTDAPQAGRLYDQSQWARSFGVSILGYPRPLAGEDGYKICRAGGGAKEPCVKAAVSYNAPFSYTFSAIEAAGPDLNDRTFAQAIFTFPAVGGESPSELRASFGRNGPGPYTLIDDVMEIWYSADRPWVDGKLGTSWYVGAGKRYGLGQWPTADPRVFVDDGSPQPPRDPDRG